MSSPAYVPAGPEAAPTLQASQPVASPTLTPLPKSNPSNPFASTVLVVVFLSLFTLAALGAAVCWIRRRRTTLEVMDERALEKEGVQDVEALAATRPFVLVTPVPEVRWSPQIRSITGPAPDEDSGRKSAVLHPKRARSYLPPNLIKPLNLFPHPSPKSAPPRALSFSQNEIPKLEKNWSGEFDPPVTPHALAVSGMQTRSLSSGRPGLGSRC